MRESNYFFEVPSDWITACMALNTKWHFKHEAATFYILQCKKVSSKKKAKRTPMPLINFFPKNMWPWRIIFVINFFFKLSKKLNSSRSALYGTVSHDGALKQGGEAVFKHWVTEEEFPSSEWHKSKIRGSSAERWERNLVVLTAHSRVSERKRRQETGR